MRDKVRGDSRLVAGADCDIHFESIPKGATLVRVGDLRRPWFCGRRRWTREEILVYLQALEEDDQVCLTFRLDRLRLPFCIVAEFPCCVLLVTLLGLGCLIAYGLLFSGLQISLNMDMSEVLEADSQAGLMQQALEMASRERLPVRRLADELLPLESLASAPGRRLSDAINLGISLTYSSEEEGPLLSSDTVAAMRAIEEQVKDLPSYKAMCKEAFPGRGYLCAHGVSLANLAFPGVVELNDTDNPGNFSEVLVSDGTGKEIPLPIAVAWSAADHRGLLIPPKVHGSKNLNMHVRGCIDEASGCAAFRAQGQCSSDAPYGTYMNDFCAASCNFCDEEQELAGENVTLIRSHFHIASPCCRDLWMSFLKELVQFFNKRNSKDGLIVTYTGHGLRDYETFAALKADAVMVGCALLFVLVYATLHTRNPFLALVGLFLVVLSLPAGLAVFGLLSGTLELQLTACLSIFIVLGVGVDMLFVYTDFWKQSLQEDSVKKTLAHRLAFMYAQAASCTAATTFTTTMSFMANLVSALRALREFGFFMGICMLMAWLIIFLAYPPVLVLVEKGHRCLMIFTSADQMTWESLDEEAEMPWRPARPTRTSSVSHTIGKVGRATIPSRHSMVNGKPASNMQRASVAYLMVTDPEKKGVSEGHSWLLSQVGKGIAKVRWLLPLLFFGLTFYCSWVAYQVFEQDASPPGLWRPRHNRFREAQQHGIFHGLNIGADNQKNQHLCMNLHDSCHFHACGTTGKRLEIESGCVCLQDARPQAGLGCRSVIVNLKVAGRGGLSLGDLTHQVLEEMLRRRFPGAQTISILEGAPHIAHLKTAHWESGTIVWVSLISWQAEVSLNNRGDSCTAKEVCYCGMAACEETYATANTSDSVPLFLVWDDGSGSSSSRRLTDQRTGSQKQKQETSPADIGLAATVLGASRRLALIKNIVAEPTIGFHQMARIDMVVGLEATGHNPLFGKYKGSYYKFMDSFDFSDVWTQRISLSLCTDLSAQLRVVRLDCALSGFVHWCQEQSPDMWPLRPEKYDVHALLRDYVGQTAVQQHGAHGNVYRGGPTRDYLWFGADGKLKALKHKAFVDISSKASVTAALSLMKHWDSFLDRFNELARSNVPSWNSWHISKLWVQAYSDKVMMDSTIVTIGISLGCVLLGVMAFTRSLHLAIIVMFAVLCVIALLFFFMVYIMEWKIGAIEILSLIVFIGFAVDYCLHIGHKYHSCNMIGGDEGMHCQDIHEVMHCPSGTSNDSRRSWMRRWRTWSTHRQQNKSKERIERAQFALKRIGSSVFGSALTTIGCAGFLIPCEIVIFMKIGSIVVAVTTLAVVFALLPLPALLMIVGPCGHNYKPYWEKLSALAKWCGFDDEEDWDDILDEDENSRSITNFTNQGRTQFFVLHMPTRGMGQTNFNTSLWSTTQVKVCG